MNTHSPLMPHRTSTLDTDPLYTKIIHLFNEADEKISILQGKYQVLPQPESPDPRWMLKDMFEEKTHRPSHHGWSDFEWRDWNKLSVRQKQKMIQNEWIRQHKEVVRRIARKDQNVLFGNQVW